MPALFPGVSPEEYTNIRLTGRRLQACFHILRQLGSTVDTVRTSVVGGLWKVTERISTCRWTPDPEVVHSLASSDSLSDIVNVHVDAWWVHVKVDS